MIGFVQPIDTEHDRKCNLQARITYIDLFRAIGIILMIMGHIGFGERFGHWIHAFHMPMFFFASGYFYKDCLSKTDFVKRLRNRCRTLLLPYLVFAFICYIMKFIAGETDILILKLIVFNTEAGGIPIAGALWFLTALFIADVVYSFVDYKLCYGVKLHIIVTVLAVVGNFMGIFLPFRLPFGFDAALVGIGFIHVARVF